MKFEQDKLYSRLRETQYSDTQWKESAIMAGREYNFDRFDFYINGYIYEKQSDQSNAVVKPLETWAALNGVFAPLITTVYAES